MFNIDQNYYPSIVKIAHLVPMFFSFFWQKFSPSRHLPKASSAGSWDDRPLSYHGGPRLCNQEPHNNLVGLGPGVRALQNLMDVLTLPIKS